MDWWQRRESERQLAQELNSAHERFRLANMKLRDATTLVSKQLHFMASDSSLLTEQASRECAAAYKAYLEALEQWKHFVISGKVPEIENRAST